jgi:hypothetical protein
MAEQDDVPTPPPLPRRPVAAVLATLVAAAAIIGYSAYWFAVAIGLFLHCNPAPKNVICTGTTFWGFDPTFFLLAVIVGFTAGAALTILAFILWFRPRDHTLLGTLILAFSVVSIVAYGGYYVGIAAGCAGGILALLFRPPRYRELTQWSGRPTGRVAGNEEFPGRRHSPRNPAADSPAAEVSGNAPLSPEAYAPLPPPHRVYPPPALGRPAPPPTSPELPRFGSISEALAARAPGPAPAQTSRPNPTAPPLPKPIPRTAGPEGTGALPSPTTLKPRPLAPAASVTAPPPPASRTSATAAPPVVLPRSARAVDGVAPTQVNRGRSWKCPKCGLTNAPWSTSCTRCHSPAPVF